MKRRPGIVIGILVAATVTVALVTATGSPNPPASSPATTLVTGSPTVRLDQVGVSFAGPGWTSGALPVAAPTAGIVHLENDIDATRDAHLIVYVADGTLDDPHTLIASYATDVHAAVTSTVTSGPVVRADFTVPATDVSGPAAGIGWYGTVLWVALPDGRVARVEVRTTDRALTLQAADRVAATITVRRSG